jgi:transcriptional regulator with PAS, ATPase and Fis domain
VPRPVEGVAADARETLERYAWPGNVRELENVIHRAMLLAGGGRITLECLPEFVRRLDAQIVSRDTDETDPSLDESTRLSLADAERRAIERALEASGGNVTRAAKRLGIARATIYRKMARLGLLARPIDE